MNARPDFWDVPPPRRALLQVDTDRAVRGSYRRACIVRALFLVGWGAVIGSIVTLALRAWWTS